MSFGIELAALLNDTERGVSWTAFPSGISGGGTKTTIPKGASSTLFYAKELDLVHEGDGHLYLYKCQILRLVTKPGTHLHLYDCKFLDKLELEGTTGRIEGSSIRETDETKLVGSVVKLREPWVIITNRSSLEIIRTNFKNTAGMRKICEIFDSVVSFQECRVLMEFNECITAEASDLRISRSSFYSKYACTTIKDGSSITVSSSHLKGNEAFCLVLSGACVGRVTDCQHFTAPDGSEDLQFIPKLPAKESKGLFGAGAVVRLTGGSTLFARDTDINGGDRLHDYGINADSGSIVEFSSSTGGHDMKGGSFPAVFANGAGTVVRILNYRFINSHDLPCIQAIGGAEVFISGAEIIDSGTDEAIHVERGATVELEGVGKVIGKTWGVVMKDHAKLIVRGPTALIEGAGEDGIIADTNCTVSLDDVTLVDGAKSGIVMKSDCRLTLLDVDEVLGLAEDGINLSERSYLLARGTSGTESKITGQKSAIVMGTDCRGVALDYSLIEGKSENGLELSDGTRMEMRGILELKGQKNGVTLADGSRWHARSMGKITGNTKRGIDGTDNCSLSLLDVELVEGLTGGVWVLGNSEYVHLRNIETIRGFFGDGVQVDCRGLSIRSIALIQTMGGTASGIVVSRATGKISKVEEVDAYWAGMQILNGSNVSAANLPKCIGKNSPHGIDIIGATFRGEHINFGLDGLAADATAEFSKVTFGGAFVASKSSLRFDSCFVNGHAIFDEVSYDILNSKFDGSQENTNSSGTTRNYTQSSIFTDTDSSSHHVNPNLTGTVTAIGSSITIEGGQTGAQTLASGSTITGNAVNFGAGVDGSGASTIELNSCTVNGSVTAALSALVLRACNSGGVALNGGSSLVAHAGTLGTVSVSSSSAAIFSANCSVIGIAAQNPIPCGPGDTVIVGTGNRYVAHDDKSVEWYKDRHYIYSEKDISIWSRTKAYVQAPDVNTEEIIPPKPEP